LGLRITTWNANSVRLRVTSLRRIVAEIRLHMMVRVLDLDRSIASNLRPPVLCRR
jgi:hypothetical protein